MLLTSLLVLAVVCLVAWLIVRHGGRWLGSLRGQDGLLHVIARVPLEPRRSLYVVEVAGKTLLVGTSEMGLSVLSELDGSIVRAELGQRPRGGGLAALVHAAAERRRNRSIEVGSLDDVVRDASLEPMPRPDEERRA